MIAVPGALTLNDFLRLPAIEESPAWEYLDGGVMQKPMPGGKHSRLQLRLASAINASTLDYEALPELRCTFGGRSLVPDLVVVAKDQIPVDADGEIISAGLEFAPPWVIEILSPDQNQTKVTRKLLHTLRHGGQMGWLVDPLERVVLAYRCDRFPDELTEAAALPCIEGIDLQLTAEQLFGWLRVGV
ncbi:MAG: Uma2 family endonuclease [Leptolyngbyaceae cyanobacterium]